MLFFLNTVNASRELKLALQNPIIQSEKKLVLLNQLFKGKVSQVTSSFFTLITRKTREAMLFEVAQEFHAQYNELNNIEVATITTPFRLTDDLRAEFTKAAEKISGKKIELKEKVDASLIGGFVLKIKDRQIDNSVQSRLNELRMEFTGDHSTFVKSF